MNSSGGERLPGQIAVCYDCVTAILAARPTAKS